MSEPKTDQAKITWLWKRRDEDKATMAGLEDKLTAARDTNARLVAEARELRNEITRLHGQVRVLGVEVNDARAAALTAVTDYRQHLEG